MSVNIEANEQRILELLWQRKALSRWEIHELTGVTPNEAGREVAKLIKSGLLRERVPNVVGPGRPRVPVEIDPVRRYVLGLAIRPGHIESARLNLLGGVPGRQTPILPGKIATPATLGRTPSWLTIGVGIHTIKV